MPQARAEQSAGVVADESRGGGDVQGLDAGRHRDREPLVDRRRDLGRQARRFAAEHEDRSVRRLELEQRSTRAGLEAEARETGAGEQREPRRERVADDDRTLEDRPHRRAHDEPVDPGLALHRP